MTRLWRHGLPAGVSVVLGAAAGLLGNAFADGWRWPIGAMFAVAVAVEAGWVGSRAVAERRAAAADDRSAASIQIGEVSAPGGQAAGVNYGEMRQERDR
ncbi:hypothetical protein [Dactylosporangium sp. NPDC049140]|uniref:hypothetical protein n=1 Tax=Dactylosporangium sp. NPDC049140 TaxID=3155647 RepID=UPI0033C2D2A0